MPAGGQTPTMIAITSTVTSSWAMLSTVSDVGDHAVRHADVGEIGVQVGGCRLVRQGKGPPRLKFDKKVRFLLTDALAWLAAQK